MIRAIAAAVVAILAGVVVQAQAPAAPPGFGVRPVLENATVNMIRLLLAPGAREQPHTHSYSMLVVWLTRGDVEMLSGAASTKRTRQPGELEFIARETSHAAANVGTSPFEVLVIAIKPDRVRAGTAPPGPSPANIVRTPLLDNADAGVTRVEFAPTGREQMHTHPYDLIGVVMTPGRLELQVGNNKEAKAYSIGDVFFIPRNESHAGANVGTSPFVVLGVAIK